MWSQVSFLGNTFDYDHIETSSHAHQIKFHAKSGWQEISKYVFKSGKFLSGIREFRLMDKMLFSLFPLENLLAPTAFTF